MKSHDLPTKQKAVKIRRPALFVAAALTLASCATYSAEATSSLVPHQAIYKLELASDSPTSRFNGVDGASVSLLEKTCEGWRVEEQVAMTMLMVSGAVIQRELRYRAQETFDGNAFAFETLSRTNGSEEKYSGSARRSADGAGEVEYITPTPMEMQLPEGTNFYLGLTQWLLSLANSGQRTGQTFSFDGTDDQGSQKVTAFVLPESGPAPQINGDEELLQGKAWRVRLAFFANRGQASEPEFEVALRLLENGIITNFTLVFEDLTVEQTMEDVLPALDERCG